MALAETARLIASLELKDQFSAPAQKIDRTLSGLDRHFADTGSRAYKAGQQVGAGIRNAAKLAAGATVILGTAATAVFTSALKAASDLGETVSKVGVVFKSQAARVLAFGKTSAAALGLSENAADSAAATYGNLFVSMGLAEKKSADMSIALVKLAGDLASFNNIDPAEALEKLRAGLTGESEPLKTLGINLNEQTLKAKALELGLVKLSKGQKTYTAVLDPATKAQAAYALIMEQSKTAQGDFARTSGGLANQTRILKANFENLKTSLATPALPKIALIFQRINAEVVKQQPAIAKLGDTIAGLFSEKNIDAGFKAVSEVFDTAKKVGPVLIDVARQTASFMKVAVDAFRSLPPDIQRIAIGALAVNKLTGGLVTNVAGGIVGSILGKLKSAVVNVQGAVVNVGGVPGDGVAGAAAGGLSPVSAFLGLLGAAGVEVAVAGLAHDALLRMGIDLGKGVDLGPVRIGGPTEAQRVRQQNLANVPVSPAVAAAVAGAVTAALRSGGVATSRILTGGGGSATRTKDDRVDLVTLQRGANALLSDGFRRMVEAIKSAKTAEQIRAAIKTAIQTVVTQGRGNVQSTVKTLAALKEQLKNADTPKLRAEIKAAIAKIADKLPGRQFAAQTLAKFNGLLADGRLSRADLGKAKEYIRQLNDRGLPHAASVISDRLAAAQRAIVNATDAARRAQVEAIKDKDMSPTVVVNNRVNTTISVSSLGRVITTSRLYGNRYQF